MRVRQTPWRSMITPLFTSRFQASPRPTLRDASRPNSSSIADSYGSPTNAHSSRTAASGSRTSRSYTIVRSRPGCARAKARAAWIDSVQRWAYDSIERDDSNGTPSSELATSMGSRTTSTNTASGKAAAIVSRCRTWRGVFSIARKPGAGR